MADDPPIGDDDPADVYDDGDPTDDRLREIANIVAAARARRDLIELGVAVGLLRLLIIELGEITNADQIR